MTAKAYWTTNNTIHDMDGLYRYRAANREVMTRYGAKFLAMQGKQDIVEGNARPNWTLVEFLSFEAASNCYYDPAYQKAAQIRHSVAEELQSLVEGYDGPQDF